MFPTPLVRQPLASSSTTTDAGPAHLARAIGPLGAFAIVAGSMSGIGIFLSPSIVATHLPHVVPFFAVWILGGLTALAGAVACGELGTMMPEAGGDYVFQHEAYGPSVAFASGWVLSAAIFCGSIATMAVGVCKYQLSTLTGMDMSQAVATLPLLGDISAAQFAAACLIPVLTFVNTHGVALSTRTQIILTLAPIGILSVAAVYAIAFADAAPVTATAALADVPWTLHDAVVAYMAVYFAYSGWINVIYVAGEVRSPDRNIPLGLLSGTIAVTVVYLLLCWGFLSVLGMQGVQDAGESGTAVATLLAGDAGRVGVALLIGAALLASINGTILAGARVVYAMSRRGAMPAWVGRVGEHGVPARALALQAALSVVLVVTGRFEELYSMVSLAMVVTGMLTVGALFVLRRRRPEWPRPYKATGYPLVPGGYIASSLLVIAVMVQEAFSMEPGSWYPLLGLAILIVMYVFHRLYLRAGGRRGLSA